MTAMAWDNAEQNEPGGVEGWVGEVVRFRLAPFLLPLRCSCYDAFLDFLFS